MPVRRATVEVWCSRSGCDGVEYVDRLVGHLQDVDVPAWIDKAGIDYGTRWTQVIRDAVDTCSAFVIVTTPAAEESEWVEREIQRAEKKAKQAQLMRYEDHSRS